MAGWLTQWKEGGDCSGLRVDDTKPAAELDELMKIQEF